MLICLSRRCVDVFHVPSKAVSSLLRLHFRVLLVLLFGALLCSLHPMAATANVPPSQTPLKSGILPTPTPADRFKLSLVWVPDATPPFSDRAAEIRSGAFGGVCWAKLRMTEPAYALWARIVAISYSGPTPSSGGSDWQNVPISLDTWRNYANYIGDYKLPLDTNACVNGSYTISAQIEVAILPPGARDVQINRYTDSIHVQMQNLTISRTTPNAASIIKWDPDHPKPIACSVTVKALQRMQCSVGFSIKDATGQRATPGVFDEYPAFVGGSERAKTFSGVWDGMQDGPNNTRIPCPKGIYFVDAFVEQDTYYGAYEDWPNGGAYEDTASSYFLSTWADYYVAQISDDGSYSNYQLSYTLKDTYNRPASSGIVEVYNPDLQLIAKKTLSPDDLMPGKHQVPLSLADSQVSGDNEFVLRFQDNEKDVDKERRVRTAQGGALALPLAINFDVINLPQYKTPPANGQPPPKTAPYANPNLPVALLPNSDKPDPAKFDYSGAKWQKYSNQYQIDPVNTATHTNLTAKQAMDQLLKVKPKILSLFSHGGPGEDAIFPGMTFWNGTTEDPISDANKEHDWWNDDNQRSLWSYWVGAQKNRDEALAQNPMLTPSQFVVIKNLGTGVDDTKVLNFLDYACFIGCNTATQTAQVGKESPAQAAVEKGAYVASGFRNVIFSHYTDKMTGKFNPAAEEWAARFWYFLLVRRHTVKEAYDAAIAGIDAQLYTIDTYGKIDSQITGLGLFRVFHSDNPTVDKGENIHIPR